MPIPASTIHDPHHCCCHSQDPEVEDYVELSVRLKRQQSCASLSFDPHLHLLEGCDDEQLDPAEFLDIQEIGWGNGGMVFQSIHLPTRGITARKVQSTECSLYYPFRSLTVGSLRRTSERCCRGN